MRGTMEAAASHDGRPHGIGGAPAKSGLMKAVRIHNYGGPEVLQYEDAPHPRLQKDEVLIRVHAAGVNPLDWKVRSGFFKGFIQHKFPLIPGWDVSGVVEEVGVGVSNFKKGDEVFAMADPCLPGYRGKKHSLSRIPFCLAKAASPIY